MTNVTTIDKDVATPELSIVRLYYISAIWGSGFSLGPVGSHDNWGSEPEHKFYADYILPPGYALGETKLGAWHIYDDNGVSMDIGYKINKNGNRVPVLREPVGCRKVRASLAKYKGTQPPCNLTPPLNSEEN